MLKKRTHVFFVHFHLHVEIWTSPIIM